MRYAEWRLTSLKSSKLTSSTSVLNGIVAPGASIRGAFDNVKAISPDLTHIETAWAAYFVWMQNDVLALGVLLFVAHELIYFGRGLPWFIIDCIPYFRRYKIQQDRKVNFDQQWECLKHLLLSHFVVEWIPLAGLHGVCRSLGIEYDVPFPSWGRIAFQCLAFMVMEDAWFYWSHRALHYGPLYKHIHKQHHRYAAPFGICAEYAHPVEQIANFIGGIGVPFLWAGIVGGLHMFTIIIWLHIRLFQAIDAHSGYDFPWSLRNFVPIWAGADFHDDHHRYFIGNYASSFRYWDFLCGTYRPPPVRTDPGRKKD